MGLEVVEAMRAGFESSADRLPERMLAAIEAAQAAGGGRNGSRSAALYVAKKGGLVGGKAATVNRPIGPQRRPVWEIGKLRTVWALEPGG